MLVNVSSSWVHLISQCTKRRNQQTTLWNIWPLQRFKMQHEMWTEKQRAQTFSFKDAVSCSVLLSFYNKIKYNHFNFLTFFIDIVNYRKTLLFTQFYNCFLSPFSGKKLNMITKEEMYVIVWNCWWSGLLMLTDVKLIKKSYSVCIRAVFIYFFLDSFAPIVGIRSYAQKREYIKF